LIELKEMTIDNKEEKIDKLMKNLNKKSLENYIKIACNLDEKQEELIISEEF
jgi:hypothetical protein